MEVDIGVTHLSRSLKLTFEPVGRWYEAFVRKRLREHTFSGDSLTSSSSEDDSSDISLDEEDKNFVRDLDPKSWRDQDHYAVLGISTLRSAATDEQIKKAYKKKVLTHHPDKRKSKGLQVREDDDYFTCITKAYEILGNPVKRRSYDSVDHHFNNEIPSVSSTSKENFYAAFGPVFKANAVWSITKPVPELGDENASFEHVNHFYSFWYSFDSWREYSYLDEEDKEKGSDRYERKMIEKENQKARLVRKKEEMARIRQLVDNAYACDPRVQKFKEAEKAQKAAAKRAKQDAVKQRVEEEERKRREVEEEERRKQEERDAGARAQAAAAKKEKEAQKTAVKKERKQLRTRLKELDYFASNNQERIANMHETEQLAELLSLTSLQELNEKLKADDTTKAKGAFAGEVEALRQRLEQERLETAAAKVEASKQALGGDGGSASASGGSKEWSAEETQLLVKAVNLIPAGTEKRWDVIAEFMSQHSRSNVKRSAKDVLNHAKSLQKIDVTSKHTVNEKAFDKFVHDTSGKASSVEVGDAPSERYMSAAEAVQAETGVNPAPWTKQEQEIFEQALKTYPQGTPERWDRVADCLPSRTKKDCMLRFKELAEYVKAKKAAAAAAAATTTTKKK